MPEHNERRQYPTCPASVALARAQVCEFLERWGITRDNEDAQDALLVVSELASNAVLHGNADAHFSVRLDLFGDTFCIAVRDSANEPPLKRCVEDDEPNGRGLFLVSALAREWGWRTEVIGKTVWAELRMKVPTCST